MKGNPRLTRALRLAVAGGALLGTLATPVAFGNTSGGADASPDWNPVSSEQLIRMPGNLLEKSVERSLETSPLGGELETINARMRSQADLLRELKTAMADQDVPGVELRHQYLEAKSRFLDLMQRQHALREQATERRLALYRDTVDRLRRDARAARDPIARDLVERQREARARMEASAQRVDSALALISFDADSGYSEEYDLNVAKIDQLRAEIASHPMEQGPEIDGEVVTREAYLRHLIAQAEADAALLAQEREIFGYMARLVALDARQLEAEVVLGVDGVSPTLRESTPKAADAVDFFLGR